MRRFRDQQSPLPLGECNHEYSKRDNVYRFDIFPPINGNTIWRQEMDLTTYVAHTHKASEDTALWDTLKSFLLPYGFDSLIFCLMSDHPSIGEKAKHGIISGYPADWMKHYTACNFEPIDPIRKESLVNPQNIFTWEGVNRVRPYNKKERAIL